MTKKVEPTILLEVSRRELDDLSRLRDWALKFHKYAVGKDSFLEVLAFRLALDADCLGQRIICRGLVNEKYSLAVAKKNKKKSRR